MENVELITVISRENALQTLAENPHDPDNGSTATVL